MTFNIVFTTCGSNVPQMGTITFTPLNAKAHARTTVTPALLQWALEQVRVRCPNVHVLTCTPVTDPQ